MNLNLIYSTMSYLIFNLAAKVLAYPAIRLHKCKQVNISHKNHAFDGKQLTSRGWLENGQPHQSVPLYYTIKYLKVIFITLSLRKVKLIYEPMKKLLAPPPQVKSLDYATMMSSLRAWRMQLKAYIQSCCGDLRSRKKTIQLLECKHFASHPPCLLFKTALPFILIAVQSWSPWLFILAVWHKKLRFSSRTSEEFWKAGNVVILGAKRLT